MYQCQARICKTCGQSIPLKLLVKNHFKNNPNKWFTENDMCKIFCIKHGFMSNIMVENVNLGFIIRAKEGHKSFYKYNRGKK